MTKSALLAASLAAALLPSLAPAQGNLPCCQGKNRLLLVFVPSKSDPRRQKQNALLHNSAEAFRNRDLVRLDYLETSGANGAAVRAHHGIKPGQFRVLLIGKDGHMASGSPIPIAVSELTSQIDRMPMRRDEMRRRGR